jgi:hypothetical protein
MTTVAAFPPFCSRYRWVLIRVGTLSDPQPLCRPARQSGRRLLALLGHKGEPPVAGDPRPSLEERYGTHQGHVCVVTVAANRNVTKGFLLLSDAQKLISQATASNVLTSLTPTSDDIALAASLCSSSDAQGLTATGWVQ